MHGLRQFEVLERERGGASPVLSRDPPRKPAENSGKQPPVRGYPTPSCAWHFPSPRCCRSSSGSTAAGSGRGALHPQRCRTRRCQSSQESPKRSIWLWLKWMYQNGIFVNGTKTRTYVTLGLETPNFRVTPTFVSTSGHLLPAGISLKQRCSRRPFGIHDVRVHTVDKILP